MDHAETESPMSDRLEQQTEESRDGCAFEDRSLLDGAPASRAGDSDGPVNPIHIPRRSTETADVIDGKSAVLSVPESARTAVFMKGKVEIRRIPIRLAGADVTVISP